MRTLRMPAPECLLSNEGRGWVGPHQRRCALPPPVSEAGNSSSRGCATRPSRERVEGPWPTSMRGRGKRGSVSSAVAHEDFEPVAPRVAGSFT